MTRDNMLCDLSPDARHQILDSLPEPFILCHHLMAPGLIVWPSLET